MSTKSDKDLDRSLDSPPDTDFFGDAAVRYARTDEKGRARLSSFPGKQVTAIAGARGFLPSEPFHVLLPDDRDQEIELKLQHGGSVTVRVLDARGQPVEGVGIQHKRSTPQGEDEDSNFDRGTLKTDATGTRLFDALAIGAHAFRLSDTSNDRGWIDEDRQDASEGWVESVVSEASTATLDFVAPSRGGLYGAVREGGQPLEGARLHLVEVRNPGEETDSWFSPGSNDPFTAVADHEGRYRYEGLRCGNYRLQVSHPSRRMPAVFDVAIENPARLFDVDLDVASLEGRVTGEDGTPLAGIEVQARSVRNDDNEAGNWRMVLTEDERGQPRIDYRQDAKANDKTDAGGRYVLRGVRAGDPLSVWASGDLVVPGNVEGITLGPDEARRGVDFSLKYAGAIEVTLAAGAPGGRNRGWYQVRAIKIAEDGREQTLQMNYLGDWNRTCRLRSLEPGKYKVAFSPGGGEDGPPADVQAVEVAAGQVAKIVFQQR
jgi:protocatechuate 3,4-dioxygenase beta subunit